MACSYWPSKSATSAASTKAILVRSTGSSIRRRASPREPAAGARPTCVPAAGRRRRAEQRLALDVDSAESRRLRCDLVQLVARFPQLPQHHRNVSPAKAKLCPQVLLHVGQDIESARVVAMRLSQTLAALGAFAAFASAAAAWRTALRSGCGRLAREPARLLEVPGDDLDELVRATREGRHPVREANVKLDPPAFRNLSVRDVAHEDVLERVFIVARDAWRRGCAATKSRCSSRVERPWGSSGGRPSCGAEVRNCTGPEDAQR